jgi:hypothetical protein
LETVQELYEERQRNRRTYKNLLLSLLSSEPLLQPHLSQYLRSVSATKNARTRGLIQAKLIVFSNWEPSEEDSSNADTPATGLTKSSTDNFTMTDREQKAVAPCVSEE